MSCCPRLSHRPVTVRAARAFVGIVHRHNRTLTGCKWALGAYLGDELVGVVVVGRTNAAALDTQLRCQVIRCATDGTRNVCSFLYARARRVAQAMGYTSCKSYDRADESGASMRALGLTPEAEVERRSWDRPGRRRQDKTELVARRRYELIATDARD